MNPRILSVAVLVCAGMARGQDGGFASDRPIEDRVRDLEATQVDLRAKLQETREALRLVKQRLDEWKPPQRVVVMPRIDRAPRTPAPKPRVLRRAAAWCARSALPSAFARSESLRELRRDSPHGVA